MKSNLCIPVFCFLSAVSFVASGAEINISNDTARYIHDISSVQPEIGEVVSDIVKIKQEFCGEKLTPADVKGVISQDQSFSRLLKIKTLDATNVEKYQGELQTFRECKGMQGNNV
ncbi:UNVERIFIED_ORG: hypothetical protein FHU00_5142 [Citrobacter freundii]